MNHPVRGFAYSLTHTCTRHVDKLSFAFGHNKYVNKLNSLQIMFSEQNLINL